MKSLSMQGYYEVKNSKFMGFFFDVKSEGEAEEYIKQLRSEHKKATHVCFAMIITGDNFVCKCSDDKEPSGTAGRPILNVLEKQNKKNCLLCVVRYFGGVKLGAGGVLRAYTKCASLTLKEVENGNY